MYLVVQHRQNPHCLRRGAEISMKLRRVEFNQSSGAILPPLATTDSPASCILMVRLRTQDHHQHLLQKRLMKSGTYSFNEVYMIFYWKPAIDKLKCARAFK